MLVKSASRAVFQAVALAGLLAALTAVLGGCASHAARPRTPVLSGTPAQPPETDPASAMVRNATAMLGQPYRFGGAAPGGFDCSGLVVFAAQSACRAPPASSFEAVCG